MNFEFERCAVDLKKIYLSIFHWNISNSLPSTFHQISFYLFSVEISFENRFNYKISKSREKKSQISIKQKKIFRRMQIKTCLLKIQFIIRLLCTGVYWWKTLRLPFSSFGLKRSLTKIAILVIKKLLARLCGWYSIRLNQKLMSLIPSNSLKEFFAKIWLKNSSKCLGTPHTKF